MGVGLEPEDKLESCPTLTLLEVKLGLPGRKLLCTILRRLHETIIASSDE